MSSDNKVPSAVNGSPTYFPSLDGLRLLCCLAVVIGHGMVGHPAGKLVSRLSGMGVNVFFSLSGFLITTLLLREKASRGRISLKNFYLRRVLRIFPVYYAAVALGIGLLVVLGDRYARPFGTHVSELNIPMIAVTHVSFLANWVNQPLPTTLDVLWSVCIEEQFYLLFPVTFAFRNGRWTALRPIMVGLALCWAARWYLVHASPESVSRNTFAHGDHLLFGALLAQVIHEVGVPLTSLFQRFGRNGGDLLSVSMLGVLVVVESRAEFSGTSLFIDYIISATLCALVVGTMASGDGVLARALARDWPRFLGQLTYAGYVFHMYALAVAWFVLGQITQDVLVAAPLRTLLAIPLLFLLAYFVRIAFEARILALKVRFTGV